MIRKIALIPVDARPVTSTMAVEIGNLVNWEVIVPDKRILGFLKTPANIEEIFTWMARVASEVEGMIVSVDMILYGGLVPSRINTEEASVLQERLKRLLELRKENPNLKLMLFSSTMRISNNNVNIEEKDYWNLYGEKIWKLSYYFHRYNRLENIEDFNTYEKIRNEIPANILEDYKWTRKRNFKMNLSLIDLVKNNEVDLLIFPQDDTSEFGFNILEQEKLKKAICQEGLFDKVLIYPGADEVASLLVARLIYSLEKIQFPTYYPVYSGLKGALTVARYEDRTIQESIKGQIFAFGSHTVESIDDADIVLGVNVPGERQGEIALQQSLNEVDTNNRNVGEWIRKLKYYADKGMLVGIIDVAYANGADGRMIPQLLTHFTLDELAGFAAWNTAGNTIGTVVAQSALIHLAEKKEINIDYNKIRLLLIRLLDDYLYQSVIRQTVRKEVDEDRISSEELLKTVRKYFIPQAHLFIKEIGLKAEIEDVYLPWNRTFEIDIIVK